MDRMRRVIPRQGSTQSAEYEPLAGAEDTGDTHEPVIASQNDSDVPFSWLDCSVFGFLGMAMLWSWYASLVL